MGNRFVSQTPQDVVYTFIELSKDASKKQISWSLVTVLNCIYTNLSH